MKNRVANYNNYDDVKKYAVELADKTVYEPDEFKRFIDSLKTSTLTAEQKLALLSVESSNNQWLAITKICRNELKVVSDYLALLQSLIKFGVSPDELTTHIMRFPANNNMTFLLQLTGESGTSLQLIEYLKFLENLVHDKIISAESILKMLSKISYAGTLLDTAGTNIATNHNAQVIREYINLLIALSTNGASVKEIQALNSITNKQKTNFIEALIKNKNNTKAADVYQLIKHQLLSPEEIEIAKTQPGINELIEEDDLKVLKVNQEKFKSYTYDDYLKHARELVNKSTFQKNEFKEFMILLGHSGLTPTQKLTILSVKSDEFEWFLTGKMIKHEIYSFEYYLLLMDDLVAKGAPISEIYNHLATRSTLMLGNFIATTFPQSEAMSSYLNFLLKLMVNHKETAVDYVYKLLLDTSTKMGLTMGQRLAGRGDQTNIQSYINILIELKKYGKTETEIHVLHGLIFTSDYLLEKLLLNENAKEAHFYQLIVNKLIPPQQINQAIFNNNVLLMLIDQYDFSDFHIAESIIQKLIFQSGRVESRPAMKQILFKLQNSKLTPQQKLDLLSLRSSESNTLGMTVGHIVTIHEPALTDTYLEFLQSLVKQNVSVAQISELVLRKTHCASIMSLIKNSDSLVLIQFLIELKNHGLELKKIHDIFYASVSTGGTSEIKLEFSGLYQIKNTGQYLYLLLNNHLCAKDVIEKLANAIRQSKECLLEYIKSLPSEEKIQALKNATTPAEPEHPLYTFMNVKRGFKKTSTKRGVLGLMHEELSVVLEKQKNQSNIQSTTANREQDDIDLLRALANSLQTKEKEDILRLNAGIPLASSNMTMINNTVFIPNLVPSAPQQSMRMDFRETMQNGYSVDRNVLFAKKNENQQAKATVTEKIQQVVPVVDLISFENEPLESKALLDKNLEKEKPQLIVKEKVKEVAPIKDLIDFDEVPVQLVRNVDKILQEKTPENMSNKKLSFYARVYPILDNTTFKPIPQPDEEIPQLDKEIKTRYVNLVHAKEGQIITKLASSTDDIINLNPIKQQENTQKVEVAESVVHEPIKTDDVANTEVDKSETIFPAVPNHDPKLFPSINNNVSESKAPKNNEVKNKVKISQLA